MQAIPLGAAIDHGLQGDYREMSISLAGDAAMLFSAGLSRVAWSSEWYRTSKAFAFVGGATELGIGGTRLYDSAESYAAGNYTQAAGHLGEAFLRLLGAYDAVKVIRKKVPVNKLVDDVLPPPSSHLDDLAPDNLVDSVPSVKGGEFNRWFDELTPDELDEIWTNPSLRDAIESRLRHPGGLHEWHLVSRTPVFKRWELTAAEIKEIRTLIRDVKFVKPVGRHVGKGSTRAHNELLEIIDSSLNYGTFLRRLRNWANYRLEGGVNALPPGLRP